MFACWAMQHAGWQAWDQQPTKEGQCTVVHTRNRQRGSWCTVPVFWRSLGYFNALYKRQAWFHIIQETLMKINHNKSPVSTTTQYYCVFHSVDSARQDLPIEQREYVHMPVPIR